MANAAVAGGCTARYAGRAQDGVAQEGLGGGRWKGRVLAGAADRGQVRGLFSHGRAGGIRRGGCNLPRLAYVLGLPEARADKPTAAFSLSRAKLCFASAAAGGTPTPPRPGGAAGLERCSPSHRIDRDDMIAGRFRPPCGLHLPDVLEKRRTRRSDATGERSTRSSAVDCGVPLCGRSALAQGRTAPQRLQHDGRDAVGDAQFPHAASPFAVRPHPVVVQRNGAGALIGLRDALRRKAGQQTR